MTWIELIAAARAEGRLARLYRQSAGGGQPTIGGCFIATAAFDDAQARELQALRAFRDDVLLKSAAGVALVDAYYTVSPPLADAVAERPWLASGVRAMLIPVARTVEQPAWLLLPAGALMAGAVAMRTRRRKDAGKHGA